MLIVCCLMVQVGVTQEKAEKGEETKKADQQLTVEQKLALKLGKVEFKNTPFEDAVQYLRDVTGLSIFVKWDRLEAYSITKSAQVDIHLENVPAESVLKFLLEDTGGGLCQIGYYINDDGVVIISTMEEIMTHRMMRVYRIGDLAFATRRDFYELGGRPWTGSRLTDLGNEKVKVNVESSDSERQATTKPDGEEENVKNIIASPLDYEESTKPKPVKLNRILQLIVDSIEPDSWQVNGGYGGDISLINDSLVVAHTREVHVEIERLLAQLREARNQNIGVAVVRISKADSLKKLDELVSKGGDVTAALQKGETDGLWTLDRCGVEKLAFGQVVLASDIHEHKLASGDNEMTTLTGYEIGVLPKAATDYGMLFSVACASAWYPAGHDPRNDTPEKNAGVTKRHNVFDFTLPAGGARSMPVIPADSKPGCIRLIVWLPETDPK